MKKTPIALWLFFPIVLLAFVASGQTLPLGLELELGYRWTDVTGNDLLYRTQINERDGFVLRSLSYYTPGLGGTDHFRVDASDLGASPAGTFRLETGKAGLYKVRFGYRSFDSFRAYPTIANPLLSQGIIPGQHTFDRNRTMFDADVEYLGFSKFTPFAGYSHGRNEGPGTTTYTLGGDDFLLGSDLDEKDTELRVGTGFNFGKVYGSVTQGWRTLSTRERLTLFQGSNSGNNGGPVLGRDITAGGISRNAKTDVDAPFTNLYVIADLIPRTKLIGTFVAIGADADSEETESATGQFISFGASRFFTGFDETVASNAENNTWRGGLRAEVALRESVTLHARYEQESREIGGTALIDTLLSNTLTLGGITAGDFEELLRAKSALDREEDTYAIGLSARAIGPFSFRVEAKRSELGYEIAPDISEIVVPGNQGSNHERTVDTIELATTYARPLFLVGLTYRVDDGSRPILRTDFSDRNRLRLRASLWTPNRMFRFGFTGEKGSQENLREDIGFDADTRLYSGDVEFQPKKHIRFHGAYSRIDADSTIITRRPETFAPTVNEHFEKGESVEGGLGLLFDPFTVDASISRFQNEGTLPFEFERYRIRVTYDVFAKAGLAAEWSNDEYDENAVFGQYEATRYGIFLRLRP